MIRFYTRKKHKKNTRHQKVPKDSFNHFIFYNKILHAQKAQKRTQGTKSTKNTKKYKNAT